MTGQPGYEPQSGYEPQRERVPERDRVMEEHPTRPAYEASMTRERGLAAAEATYGRDIVHWGPVWTGVLGAFAIFVLLEMLVTAFGWVALNGTANASAIWWSAIIGIFAFFVGGWIAGSTSAARDAGNGLANGFAVWALGTVLLLAITTLGAGGALGAASGAGVTFNRHTVANVAQTAAIGIFIFLLVAVIAALVGAYLGHLTPVGPRLRARAR